MPLTKGSIQIQFQFQLIEELTSHWLLLSPVDIPIAITNGNSPLSRTLMSNKGRDKWPFRCHPKAMAVPFMRAVPIYSPISDLCGGGRQTLSAVFNGEQEFTPLF